MNFLFLFGITLPFLLVRAFTEPVISFTVTWSWRFTRFSSIFALFGLLVIRTQICHVGSLRLMSPCEAMATHYSKMMAICYSNSQLWCYINSNLLLSKAKNETAVDLNAFFLIWFVPTRSWEATFSGNNPMMSWQLVDESTSHLYNLKHLFWSWEDQAIHLCVLYLNIHPIHTQSSLHINSYLPLYHHHYLCINLVVLLVTHKTTRS